MVLFSQVPPGGGFNLKKMQVAIRARLEPESLILQWLIALDVYLGVLIAALSRTVISDLVFEYVKARYEIYYLLNRVPHPLATAYLKRRRQRPVDRSGRLGSVFEHPLWFAYDELAGTVDLDADIYEQALAESIERRMDGEPDDGSLDTAEHDVWRLCRDGINRGEQAIFQASGPYGVVADAGYMRTVADLAYADALADCLHAQLRIRAQGSVDSPGDEMPRKLDAWKSPSFIWPRPSRRGLICSRRRSRSTTPPCAMCASTAITAMRWLFGSSSARPCGCWGRSAATPLRCRRLRLASTTKSWPVEQPMTRLMYPWPPR